MAPTRDAEALTVGRCEACGKFEVRHKPRSDPNCPECGAASFTQAPFVAGAIGYSVSDRRSGPSVEDGRLGRMAYFAGWMQFDQIATCLRRQAEARNRKKTPPKFGEVAVAEGFLTEARVTALLRIQVIHEGPPSSAHALGALAVHAGYLALDQLDESLLVQKSLLQRYGEAPTLGIILVEMRRLTPGQVKELLEIQAQHGAGPLAELRRSTERGAEPPSAGEQAAAGTKGVSTGELAGKQALYRCGRCRRVELRKAWTVGDVCPICGSVDFAPVPISAENADAPSGAEAGPSIRDTRLGRLAFFAGWMTQERVDECLRIQESAAKGGGSLALFGEVALASGYLSEQQVKALLRIQSIHRSPKAERAFGGIAVARGLITQEQLDDCLAEQKRLLRETRQSPSLGILLTDKGLLSDDDVKAVLAHQAESWPARRMKFRPRKRFD